MFRTLLYRTLALGFGLSTGLLCSCSGESASQLPTADSDAEVEGEPAFNPDLAFLLRGQEIPVDRVGPFSALTDWSQDGSPDLITYSNQFIGEIPFTRLLENDGNGNFSLRGLIPATQSGFLPLLPVKDLNGDGAPDFLVQVLTDGPGIFRLEIHSIQRDATTSILWNGPVLEGYLFSNLTVDWDFDGDLDVVVGVASTDLAEVLVYENKGEGRFIPVGEPLAELGSSVFSLEDINGDRLVDLSVAGGRLLDISLGVGPGVFAEPVRFRLSGFPQKLSLIHI